MFTNKQLEKQFYQANIHGRLRDPWTTKRFWILAIAGFGIMYWALWDSFRVFVNWITNLILSL